MGDGQLHFPVKSAKVKSNTREKVKAKLVEFRSPEILGVERPGRRRHVGAEDELTGGFRDDVRLFSGDEAALVGQETLSRARERPKSVPAIFDNIGVPIRLRQTDDVAVAVRA